MRNRVMMSLAIFLTLAAECAFCQSKMSQTNNDVELIKSKAEQLNDSDRIDFVESYTKGKEMLDVTPLQGIELLESSASSGYPNALYLLGIVFSSGKYQVATDYKKAAQYFEGAMRADKDIVDKTASAKKAREGKVSMSMSPLEKYIRYAQPYASYRANIEIAYLYLDGKLGKPDAKTAIEYFSKTEPGLGELAMTYYIGRGAIKQDKAQAIQIMKNAHDKGKFKEFPKEASAILGSTLLNEWGGEYQKVLKKLYVARTAREAADIANTLPRPSRACWALNRPTAMDQKHPDYEFDQALYRLFKDCQWKERQRDDLVREYRKKYEDSLMAGVVASKVEVKASRCRQIVVSPGVCINLNLGLISAGATCTPDILEERCE